MPHRKIVFDLETKKTFDQVGGQGNAAALGISLVGAYDYSNGEYKLFREKDLGKFLNLLKETELLIGFNSRSFDATVLQPYFPNFDVFKIPHLDILEEIYKSIGHRLKLESVAKTTLLEGKTGDGLDAIHYFNAGDWESLAKYCLHDVRITKDVYEYGQNHGHLWYMKSGKPEIINIDFKGGETVEKILQESLQRHKQVEIEYIDLTEGSDRPERRKTLIDIRNMRKGKMQAFCHQRKGDLVLEISKISSAKPTNQSSTHQASLI